MLTQTEFLQCAIISDVVAALYYIVIANIQTQAMRDNILYMSEQLHRFLYILLVCLTAVMAFCCFTLQRL